MTISGQTVPTLTVSSAPDKLSKGKVEPYRASLSADGGKPPYHWSKTGGPDWLNVADDGTVSGVPPSVGTANFSVLVSDSSVPTLTASANLSIEIESSSEIHKHIWQRDDIGYWLANVAWFLPVFGFFWIFIYAFTTPGSHANYLGTGILTAMAAFFSGALIGFLFGIPRVVSSGQLRQTSQVGQYTPNSNLAEVSDWLTKLLLGAGLVTLTKLGGPIGNLIDTVARGLGPTTGGSSTVMAGAILFAYLVIGFLDGYIITTVWYQKKLTS